VHRKVVTVLFCDVVGSTALGESVDPEALQELLARYFERMKAIVESHGGSVEKFIGDAVMAVFGVPQVHEDDALRACRAAVEMRDVFPELGVQGRIGVNTGEVVAGTEERLVTGDAVNVAARLQQAAQPDDDVLIGQATLELVREAVEVDPVEPMALKGKSGPVSAYRLVAVRDAPERSHAVPFVGRKAEVSLILQAWMRVLEGRTCELVTTVGEAGVGKSRLVAEALASIDARIVSGRCLPYGEGITYWPVVEVIKRLDALPSDPAAAAAIRSLLGETDAGTTAEEIAWAFRKLLEEEAPLVVVLDDIQWGDETFLDLVEGAALLSSGSPILLVCMARPELADRRPQWPVTLRLEALPADAVDELIGEQVRSGLRERIAMASGGNPLFLTEMLAMASTTDEVEVPPTLRVLLAARLDQLDAPERAVLERGAVEGEIFHRGAVQALAPDEPQVTPRLAALTRKELIRPDQAQIPGEDGFRFRHLLIRDAAYDALSKATRADLHERFAAWIEARSADLVELDEIAGYHLEQAARYRAELGQPDTTLAERAGAHLAAAGRRALWRADRRAAARLLVRALALIRPIRLDMLLELDYTLSLDERREQIAVAQIAGRRALDEGDRAAASLARLAELESRLLTGEPVVDELDQAGEAALSLLEAAGNHAGLVHVWFWLGAVANTRAQFERRAACAENALRHATLAGHPPAGPFALSGGLFGLSGALVQGPRPADEALATLEAYSAAMNHPVPVVRRGILLAMLGRFDEAWSIAREAEQREIELNGECLSSHEIAEIASLAGDHEQAALRLREAHELVERREERAFLSTTAPTLGRELCILGRYEEAEPLAQLGRELGHQQDLATQAIWRQVQALVLASRGKHAEAERFAREAIEFRDHSDAPNRQADARCDLAEVLAAAGRVEEAAEAYEQALDRYGRKKNLAMVAQVQPRLEALLAEANP
jgi:class 3 adenylate cyclase/tetratricopeptide (TPR) repeat protein